MNLSHELIEVTKALDGAGIPYAICGGFAVMLHGYPRATYDLDIMVEEFHLECLSAVVSTLGFDVAAGRFAFRRGTPMETQFWRVSKFEDDDHLVLDVLMITPAIQDAWESREQVPLQKNKVWVVSRSGLKTMKLLSGRAKDLADLQQLGILPPDEVEPEPI
jgi:hypothetical protein